MTCIVKPRSLPRSQQCRFCDNLLGTTRGVLLAVLKGIHAVSHITFPQHAVLFRLNLNLTQNSTRATHLPPVVEGGGAAGDDILGYFRFIPITIIWGNCLVLKSWNKEDISEPGLVSALVHRAQNP